VVREDGQHEEEQLDVPVANLVAERLCLVAQARDEALCDHLKLAHLLKRHGRLLLRREPLLRAPDLDESLQHVRARRQPVGLELAEPVDQSHPLVPQLRGDLSLGRAARRLERALEQRLPLARKLVAHLGGVLVPDEREEVAERLCDVLAPLLGRRVRRQRDPVEQVGHRLLCVTIEVRHQRLPVWRPVAAEGCRAR